MSSFQPYMDVPYPNHAAEEAAKPYEPGPVAGVTPGKAEEGVEGGEDQPFGDSLPPAAVAALSKSGRELTRGAVGEMYARRQAEAEERLAANAEAALDEQARNSLALRELMAAFDNYNNNVAIGRYNNYLNLFARYSSVPGVFGENRALAGLRARENFAYSALGISYPGIVTREIRDRMAKAVDRWLAAEGVFNPAMLGFASSDGFRFEPLTERSRAALRATKVLADYDRQRIAGYLREVAELTPRDFLFSDPTGLGELPLKTRREFLRFVNRRLEESELALRAAELRYLMNAPDRLAIDDSAIRDAEERRRLDALQEEVSGYYAGLAASVRQYSPGIISSAFR